jgi:hypothetical protein
VKSDLTNEIVNVDLEQAMNGNLNADIVLNKEDVVTVYSIFDSLKNIKSRLMAKLKIQVLLIILKD